MDNGGGTNVPGNSFDGPVAGDIHAEQISRCFNAVYASGAPWDVKNAMGQLGTALQWLFPRLAEPERSLLATCVEGLAEQVVRPKPIKEMARFTAAGIMSVGNPVTELAVPVAQSVNAVLKALKCGEVHL